MALLNLMVGEMLSSVGFNVDFFEQQIMLGIVMIGSNPFFG